LGRRLGKSAARKKDVDPQREEIYTIVWSKKMRNIGAVILAAGESSRLGQPKQLVQFRGQSLVRRVVEAAEQAGCSPIVVVTGGDAEDTEESPHLLPSTKGEERARHRGNLVESVARELKQKPATMVTNENWRRGIGSSIRAGVQRAVDTAQCQHKEGLLEAIILLTCDQLFVDASVLKKLIRLREQTGRAIVASSYSNTLGVPALFDRSYFEELLSLGDASGAKSIILSDHDRVAEFPFPEGEIDIDTAEDYEKLVISE
jgi:molybdenum cofactor cytidylyltransferase